MPGTVRIRAPFPSLPASFANVPLHLLLVLEPLALQIEVRDGRRLRLDRRGTT
jgi:hypothetical protein